MTLITSKCDSRHAPANSAGDVFVRIGTSNRRWLTPRKPAGRNRTIT